LNRLPRSGRAGASHREDARVTNFAVQTAPRRPGDIMTMIADTSRIRGVLDWTPQYDNLETIAAHALAWEEKLFRERHGQEQHAASA